jgi:hypothetical protein
MKKKRKRKSENIILWCKLDIFLSVLMEYYN